MSCEKKHPVRKDPNADSVRRRNNQRYSHRRTSASILPDGYADRGCNPSGHKPERGSTH